MIVIPGEIRSSRYLSYSGATLLIEATGTVKETILEGAYVNLEVKYGYIRLINTQADLCKEIKNVDLECPIEKGKISIIKSVDLPKEIPPVRRPPDPRRCGNSETDSTHRANTRSRPTSTARTTSISPA